jgi:hypothetical protein
MAHYFVGVGGTGARCLEAVVYLAAAGLFDGDLHVLLIDPDANNGNSSFAEGLMGYYYLVQHERQPRGAQFPPRMMLRAHPAPPPVLFQPRINAGGQFPARWNVQQRNSRRFSEVIEYASRPAKLRNFLDLFYQSSDLGMDLEVGYQGRTNVGAVALKQDLEETRSIKQAGLHEFLAALTADLQNGEARVFISGSVFGGTGAAGIPTIPALIRGLDAAALPQNSRDKLRWGCALMAPYFTFPRNTSGGAGLGPGTDSTKHPVATQAALLHYAHTPPGYQHAYLLGSPYRNQTNDRNHPGGDRQRNLPHYAELVAALAAWDFYSLPEIHQEERKLHYADSFDNETDLGVSWETLPVHIVGGQARRAEVRQKLVSFTTFAYLYRNILHNGFISNRSYRDSAVYKENFEGRGLRLEGHAQEQALIALDNFCGSFLEWLRALGQTGGAAVPDSLPVLFNWEALEPHDLRGYEQRVGNLIQLGTRRAQRPPRYGSNGYQKIMEKLNRTRLVSPETQSAVGLFIYLLNHAVSEFCKENYDWR